MESQGVCIAEAISCIHKGVIWTRFRGAERERGGVEDDVLGKGKEEELKKLLGLLLADRK